MQKEGDIFCVLRERGGLRMMKKINELSNVKANELILNYLYTRFRGEFDTLMRSITFRAGSQEEKMLYMNDEDFEKQLKFIIDEKNNSLNFVIGYPGVGKSTSLRYVFGFNDSTPCCMEDSAVLVAPAAFNGFVSDEDVDSTHDYAKKVRMDLTLRIRSYCYFLEQCFRALKKRFDSDRGKQEFYCFLEQYSSTALQHVPDDELEGLPWEEERRLRLKYAYKEEPFIVAATKLKYYLSCKECLCNKVVIIVDDIEPLPFKYQKELIMQYCRFSHCMQNKPEGDGKTVGDKKFVANFIISLRPETFRTIKELSNFTAYDERMYYKENNIDFNQFFEKRFQLINHDTADTGEQSITEAYHILLRLVSKFSNRYSDMIKGVALWNIRDSLKLFVEILNNRVWIQRDTRKEYAFVIREKEYVFNNITVLRAIACGNAYIYRGEDSKWVPNVLCNSVDKNYVLANLGILCLFCKGPQDNELYVPKSIQVSAIIEAFRKSLPEKKNVEEDVIFCLKRLLREKVLDICVDSTYVHRQNTEDDALELYESLQLTPRGLEIWRMLESDSVYMELCREDYYRQYDNDNWYLSSYELMKNNRQEDIFQDLFVLLEEWINMESDNIQWAKEHGSLDVYVQTFGKELTVHHVYRGIYNSIVFSGKISNDKIKQTNIDIERLIANAERELQTFGS